MTEPDWDYAHDMIVDAYLAVVAAVERNDWELAEFWEQRLSIMVTTLATLTQQKWPKSHG